jgi:hypothetical protein
MDTLTKSAGIALNVWHDDTNWRMAIYPEGSDGIDSSTFIPLDYKRGQLQRYFQISEDSDWWTTDVEELEWILFGTRP